MRHLASLVLLLSASIPSATADGWKAGVGKATITPDAPTWMAGYGARDHPSEGVEHDLWAKGLALVDPKGETALLVTIDVCGIDRALSRRIRDAIQTRHKLADDRIVLACSHTHCGPVVGENLITMYPLDTAQRARVADYTKAFERQVVDAAERALAALQPASLSFGTGRAEFAVNRRNNKEPDVPALREKDALKGPVDHDVSVLTVRDASGKPRAVVAGYACHCTALSYYKFCGDYAGFAQLDLEARYPGAQAQYVAGCGADQNPLPRRTLALAAGYGKALADATARVVDDPSASKPIAGPLASAATEIPLRFATLPTRAQVESDLKSPNAFIARRARKLLDQLDRDGALAAEYPYPIVTWRLGDLTWLFLGGEVVVDYSLRFKRAFGPNLWASGYCNDVMAYIPSLRVLKEGGYEGETAMIYYGLPTRWADDVEDRIARVVESLVSSVRRPR
jgi:hypothetical protein